MDPEATVKKVIETLESWGEVKSLLVDRSNKPHRYVYVINFYDNLVFHDHEEGAIQETTHLFHLYHNTGWIKPTGIKVKVIKPKEGKYITPLRKFG